MPCRSSLACYSALPRHAVYRSPPRTFFVYTSSALSKAYSQHVHACNRAVADISRLKDTSSHPRYSKRACLQTSCLETRQWRRTFWTTSAGAQQGPQAQAKRPFSSTNASFDATGAQQHGESSSGSKDGGSSGSNTGGSSGSALETFTPLVQELDRLAPVFEIDARDIQILNEPSEFYAALKTAILRAQHRVFLATLYVGVEEHELVETLRTALARNPRLQVSVLTDFLRGTREDPKGPCCASLLARLVAEFGSERVQVRMYHTPNLAGLRKAILPKRINEGWGLQHMKLYGVDDQIMLSGANLSNDYFTDRQDRYHVFRSQELTEYYKRVHDAVCSMSFAVVPTSADNSGAAETGAVGFRTEWPRDNAGPSPLESPKKYIANAAKVLGPLTDARSGTKNSIGARSTAKTLVYPLFQLSPLLPDGSSEAEIAPTELSETHPRERSDIKSSTSTELPALTILLHLLQSAPFAPARWTFTAGYFNITPNTRDLLLASLTSTSNPGAHQPYGTLLTASPEANGFYNSAGISGMLPPAYTHLARAFLKAVHRQGKQDRLTLLEWKRGTYGAPDRWTYHAKGLWITLPGEQAGPAVTLVGSSNYTKRSHMLDLEANALVLTTDPNLQRRLRHEELHLAEWARPVGLEEYARPDRQVSWRVRLAMWITTLVGGAL